MGLPIDYVDSRRTSFGTLAPMARHGTRRPLPSRPDELLLAKATVCHLPVQAQHDGPRTSALFTARFSRYK